MIILLLNLRSRLDYGDTVRPFSASLVDFSWVANMSSFGFSLADPAFRDVSMKSQTTIPHFYSNKTVHITPMVG